MGSATRARASATRCCWPPESLVAGRFSHSFELHEAQRLRHPLADDVSPDVPDLKRIGHVIEDVHMRPDGVGLEHHAQSALLRGNADVLLLRPDHLAADADLARIRSLQPDDAAQQRGLAATAGSEQREYLVGRDRQIHVIEGRDRLAFGEIVLADALDPDFHVVVGAC